MRKILVIAPHPDDETLGCGGTLFRHKADGDEIYWVIVTGISVDTGWSKEAVNIRDNEINDTAIKFKFENVFNFRLPTGRLDTTPISDLIIKIADVYKKIEPEIIYMPFGFDVHTDHQFIAQAIQSTCKWFRHSHIKQVLMYETPSETEFNFMPSRAFQPNLFVDISNYIDSKIEVMKTYKSEMCDFPFPRSDLNLRALATFRGSQCGFKAAEAFQQVYARI